MIDDRQLFALVLGAVVKYERWVRHWPQGRLVSLVGLSQSTMSRIETGEYVPSVFQYGEIAKAFDTTLTVLDQEVRDLVEVVRQAAETIKPESLQDVGIRRRLPGLVTFVVAVRRGKHHGKISAHPDTATPSSS